MNQCHYMPAGESRSLLAYAEAWPGWTRDPNGYDTMMNAYFRERKMKYWLHVPSLVQHRVCVSQIDRRRSSTSRLSRTFVDPAPIPAVVT